MADVKYAKSGIEDVHFIFTSVTTINVIRLTKKICCELAEIWQIYFKNRKKNNIKM
jgi:phosphate starvation-inducible protein PhoH